MIEQRRKYTKKVVDLIDFVREEVVDFVDFVREDIGKCLP